jgi:hypothetical protein
MDKQILEDLKKHFLQNVLKRSAEVATKPARDKQRREREANSYKANKEAFSEILTEKAKIFEKLTQELVDLGPDSSGRCMNINVGDVKISPNYSYKEHVDGEITISVAFEEPKQEEQEEQEVIEEVKERIINALNSHTLEKEFNSLGEDSRSWPVNALKEESRPGPLYDEGIYLEPQSEPQYDETAKFKVSIWGVSHQNKLYYAIYYNDSNGEDNYFDKFPQAVRILDLGTTRTETKNLPIRDVSIVVNEFEKWAARQLVDHPKTLQEIEQPKEEPAETNTSFLTKLKGMVR